MRLGVLGGTSLLGERALPLLAHAGHSTSAFARSLPSVSCPGVTWRKADDWHGLALDTFLSFAPLWVLPDYLERLAGTQVKRVVALSSTSRFGKHASPDARERDVAQRLIRAEEQLEQWAVERQIEWVILRPTLIYGFGRDKNISEIARFIQRFGFFPLIGGGTGLRQPVHGDDVIRACLSAVSTPDLPSGAYNLSGGEVLSYHTMVRRIFQAMGRPERTLPLPAPVLSRAVSIMRCLPRYRHLSSALVARMNEDLVFDHSHASDRLGFAPRAFQLMEEDLPGR
ncbi:NAD-dependent epimerase/dehydratase family protein [Pseudomonas sp. CG7]|uniref:NAD-dependent epimerase/dehydratase family protein n=1 Tax=unclassified Pseudomonas TaxID=196821 RepID=UPI00203342DC|nr:NAD-dependent epimerase/dehydratase family protein [Pseudomonas sp. CG7]MCM2459927.1 NAD-dependent epimerase/dehydratase family protein [Pseudomonas sp. CG7]